MNYSDYVRILSALGAFLILEVSRIGECPSIVNFYFVLQGINEYTTPA